MSEQRTPIHNRRLSTVATRSVDVLLPSTPHSGLKWCNKSHERTPRQCRNTLKQLLIPGIWLCHWLHSSCKHQTAKLSTMTWSCWCNWYLTTSQQQTWCWRTNLSLSQFVYELSISPTFNFHCGHSYAFGWSHIQWYECRDYYDDRWRLQWKSHTVNINSPTGMSQVNRTSLKLLEISLVFFRRFTQ